MTTPMAAYPSAVPATPITLFAPQNVAASERRGLSDVELRVMTHLSAQLLDPRTRVDLFLSQLYAEGMNLVPSLGIAVPPELEALRAVLGWCGEAIGARSERLTMQGFRMPGQNTIDADLQEAWQANNFDAESVLVHDDAMTFRHSFVVVGANDEDPEAPPLSTVESPLNMTASWDVRRREVSAAYQTYLDVDPASETFNRQMSVLHTRDATIDLVLGDKGWEIVDRNDHGMGFVPVVMFANRPTPTNRYGRSEIAASWRNTQDRAARAVVRSEIAAEFFASMKLWILGVNKSAFENPDGSMASAWETFTGRLSTLEADKYGNLPTIIFQQGQDPAGLIKFIDHERQVFSGNARVPLDYLGMVSDGNPTSADAIGKGDFRLKKCAERLSVQFGDDWEEWARITLKMWDYDAEARPNGKYVDEARQLESEWGKFGIPTPTADTVNVTTQVAAKMIAPDDDDALAECGWTPVQRRRIAAARTRYASTSGVGDALEGLKPQQPPQQPLDGEQPAALLALQQSRDGAPSA